MKPHLAALAVLAILTVVGAGQTFAQGWRLTTPRDTVKVLANQMTPVQSKMQLSAQIVTHLTIRGTFGYWPGQNGSGFDARYTYSVPGWAAPFPLLNPPSFNKTRYEIYFGIGTKGAGLGEDSIKVLETAFQPNHVYTAKYTSSGVPFRYRIKARLDEKPDGFYYGNGTGGLTVEMAQFTAGISVQNRVLNFGDVEIGSSLTIMDSIASYGIDPLKVDSFRVVSVIGPNDYSVTSQRGASFALPTETSNEFRIRFAPSTRGDVHAFLYLYSSNTDNPNKVTAITLQGRGIAPTLAAGPKNIDFGRCRVGRTVQLPINIFNGGNGDLRITSNVVFPTGGTPVGVFEVLPAASSTNPFLVSPGIPRQLKVNFTPTSPKKFTALVTISGSNGTLSETISLTGEGGEPVPVLSDTTLEFGDVKRGDRSVRTLTLTNTGNWTANVLYAVLSGPNVSAFTATPWDDAFLVNSDSTRTFTITFAPATGPEGPRVATLELTFDDGKPKRIVQLRGKEIEPKLGISRHFVDFGKVKVGNISKDTVGLVNTSNAVLTMASPKVIPFITPWTFEASKYPGSIAFNSRDSIQISFRPPTPGLHSTWIYTQSLNQLDSILVVGVGAVARAYFLPPSIDFGIVPTGQRHVKHTSLSDTGDYPLRIARFEITGPNASSFSIDPATRKPPFDIPEGGSVWERIHVAFQTNAKTGLVHTAQLCVVYIDSSRDCIELTAQEQAQFLQFGQRSINFGKIRVGGNSQLPAILSNGSNSTLSVRSLSLDPVGPPFSLSDTTLTVGAQSSEQTMVTFSPVLRGSFSAKLHGQGGDIRKDSIDVIGVGAAPVPQFSSDLLDFDIVLNGLNKSLPLVVTNVGDWKMKAHIEIINDVYGEFSFAGVSGPLTEDSVNEGESASYTVTFAPRVPSFTHMADMLFTFDDGTSHSVRLVGSDDTPFLMIDSSRIDFGKIRLPASFSIPVHLINTSGKELTAADVSLEQTGTEFTVAPQGEVKVDTRTQKPLLVTFKPSAIGPFSALLVAKGGDMVTGDDSVIITGVGARPIPEISTPAISFGPLIVGDGDSRSFTLKNAGNWDMHVVNVSLTGINVNDYAHDVPPIFDLAPDSTLTFNVDYLATTPLQSQQRTADIVFMLDDGSTFKVELIALDRAPLETEVAFDNLIARPGDKIFANLRLKTEIPAKHAIRKFTGRITFDPTVVELEKWEKGLMLAAPEWVMTATKINDGELVYTIESSTALLQTKGSLLRLIFNARKDIQPGAETLLEHPDFAYPDTKEVVAIIKTGAIVIDSTCGSTHLTSGAPTAVNVQQNSPNPVTSGAHITEIPFEVGEDGALISVRIMDATGREVLRPISDQQFERGRYSITVDAATLGSGIFFYEFTAAGAKPIVKKMIVQ